MKLTEKELELSSKLTSMQRKFVINLVEGLSQRQAYLEAGGRAKTEGSQDAISSRMLSEAKVKAFYAALMAKSATKAVLTREQALLILTDSAQQADEYRDKHQAVKQLSDMEGWNAPKKSELTGAGGEPIAITNIERKIV